jgi:bile acid:Na+ symporter, BASS family
MLLLNAGMNIRLVALREWLRNGVALTSGLVGNFFIPLLFVLALSQVLRVWHNPEEVQNILLGLALVASMPIAGSSTATARLAVTTDNSLSSVCPIRRQASFPDH